MHANHREEMDEIYAGDIAAAVGLKETTTGDTLCTEGNPIILESMEFPRAGHPRGHRAQDQGRPGQDEPGAHPSGRGGPHLQDLHRRIHRPDHHRRHGRVASGDHRRPPAARVPRRGHGRQAAGGPTRSASRRRPSRGALRAPDRRPRPVRPLRHRDRPARAGLGYEFVNKIVGGVIPKEFIAPIDRASARRPRAACSPATKCGLLRHAAGRLLPRGRLQRNGVQDRRFPWPSRTRWPRRTARCSSR